MTKPIRILEIVNVMDRAGLETMLMNHYRHIDRDLIQLDFLTHRSCEGAYDKEIQELGGRVFRAPRLYPQNCLAYRRYMRSFFADHEYPVVHSHIDAMSAFPLAMTRLTGMSSTRSKKSRESAFRASPRTTGRAARRPACSCSAGRTETSCTL